RTGASRRISPLSQGAIRAAGADGGVEACAPGEKRRSRPISRVLSRAVIPLGAASPLRSSSLPGPDAGHVMRSLFGLAPGGVCRAGLLPGSRCALTAPFHPCHARLATPFGGIFLLHFPSARAAQALPGTVPCGARTFLGTPRGVTRLPGRLRRGRFYAPRVAAAQQAECPGPQPGAWPRLRPPFT